jgi:SAM-dependent methyltransferase
MHSCRLCGQAPLTPLLDLGRHPIAHRFLNDPSAEEYTHPVCLNICEGCGFIQINDPVPSDMLYSEYVCLSSWKPQPHLARLLSLLDQLPRLGKDSPILEVGSNDGSFLSVLRERGYTRALGVEPARDAQAAARDRGVETLETYFTPETAAALVESRGKFDLFVARQVLEHVSDLEGFMQAARSVLSPGAYVAIEVPNFEFCMTTFDYSGIWEEHVNYYTPNTLERLLAQSGIRVIHSETALFSGESLVVLGEYDGVPFSPGTEQDLKNDLALAAAFRDRWPGFRRSFQAYLEEQRSGSRKIAVYGGGCRACSFINFTGIGPLIDFVVDDQPEKQGKYMPGSRLPILPGATLESDPVGLCLLAVNTENEDKVLAKHREAEGRFLSILPPSDRLVPVWSAV